MCDNARLMTSLLPPGGGADLLVTHYPSFWVVQALKPSAQEWLEAYASEEAAWYGEGLVVEPRYLECLVEAALDDDLMLESEAARPQPEQPQSSEPASK